MDVVQQAQIDSYVTPAKSQSRIPGRRRLFKIAQLKLKILDTIVSCCRKAVGIRYGKLKYLLDVKKR
jgi:hypothetical protein